MTGRPQPRTHRSDPGRTVVEVSFSSARTQTGDFAVHSVGASSHVSLFGSIFVFSGGGRPGATSSEHRTSVALRRHCCSSVAPTSPAAKPGWEWFRAQTNGRHSEVRSPAACPEWMRDGGRGGGHTLLSIHRVSPI